MSVDYDAIAEAITPERLAEIVGAEKVAGGWRCPLGRNHEHDDRKPSFSIFRDGGRTAARCHTPKCGLAGSPVSVAAAVWGVELPEAARRLAEAIGFAPAGNCGRDREIVTTYPYVNADGELLYEVVRFAPKGFAQRRPDGNGGWIWKLNDVPRVLFRLPAVRRAIAAGKRVFIVEGEKDAHAIEAAGYTATCNPGGAGKWRPEHTEALRGANVVVVADRDEAGYAHARTIALALEGVARRVVVVEAAEGKDATDHLGAGRKLAELTPITLDTTAPIKASHETTASRNQRIRGAAVALLTTPQRVGSWGWRGVDRLVGGLVAGWFYAIGARAGNGKTTLFLGLLSRLWEDRIPTFYFGTEMPAEDLVKKWAAARLGLDEQRVFESDLDDEERDGLEREIGYLTERDEITFSTEARLDLKRLVSELNWACDARTGPAPRVVMLDHLHRITQDREELEHLAKELKEIAKERRVAMLVACQLSREKDIGPLDLHSPPSLSRYKGSAAIEENADVALGLYRPLQPGTTAQQRRAILHGQLSVAECEEPNVMAMNCLKHRFRGKAAGRSVWLAVNGSRIESRAFAAAPPAGAGDAWESSPEEQHGPGSF